MPSLYIHTFNSKKKHRFTTSSPEIPTVRLCTDGSEFYENIDQNKPLFFFQTPVFTALHTLVHNLKVSHQHQQSCAFIFSHTFPSLSFSTWFTVVAPCARRLHEAIPEITLISYCVTIHVQIQT